VGPKHAKPSQATLSSQTKPSQAKSSQAKSSQAKPSQAKPPFQAHPTINHFDSIRIYIFGRRACGRAGPYLLLGGAARPGSARHGPARPCPAGRAGQDRAGPGRVRVRVTGPAGLGCAGPGQLGWSVQGRAGPGPAGPGGIACYLEFGIMLAFEAAGLALPRLPGDSESDVSADEGDSDSSLDSVSAMSVCPTDEADTKPGNSSSYSTPMKSKPATEALEALGSAGFDVDKAALEEADSEGDGAVEVCDFKCPVTDARSEIHKWGWCPWGW
jgi:hypothetical protein